MPVALEGLVDAAPLNKLDETSTQRADHVDVRLQRTDRAREHLRLLQPRNLERQQLGIPFDKSVGMWDVRRQRVYKRTLRCPMGEAMRPG